MYNIWEMVQLLWLHVYKNRKEGLHIYALFLYTYVPNIRGTYWTYPLKTECRNQKRKRKYWQTDLELGSPTAASRVVCHTKKKDFYLQTITKIQVDYKNIEKISIPLEYNTLCSRDSYFSIHSASVLPPIIPNASLFVNIAKIFRAFLFLFFKRGPHSILPSCCQIQRWTTRSRWSRIYGYA